MGYGYYHMLAVLGPILVKYAGYVSLAGQIEEYIDARVPCDTEAVDTGSIGG